jgi:hypothetical protein
MSKTELSRAIVEGIRCRLGRGVIEPKRTKQYLSIYANGKLLVLLYECKTHIRVCKLKKSPHGNQTCETIMRVESETDVSTASQRIEKLYLAK